MNLQTKNESMRLGIAIFLLLGIFASMMYIQATYAQTDDEPFTTMFEPENLDKDNTAGNYISSAGILAVDSLNNVYVENRNHVLKFSSDGKFIARMSLVDDDLVDDNFENYHNVEITHFTNIVFDSNDNMYVSNEQSKIFKFTNDGKLIKKYNIFRTSSSGSNSIGIALDSKDDIYAFSSDHGKDDVIQKFTNDGDLITSWNHCRDKSEHEKCEMIPTAIMVDHNDDIYVAYYPSHIQKFSSDGEFLAEWKSSESEDGQFINVRSMASDSKNNIYVAVSENNKIIKFSPHGEFITELGHSGNDNGQFLGIGGIAIDSKDNIYVSDKRNDRIQKFSKDSIFITKAGNAPPVSDAGKDQHVREGTQVTLDGTKSHDPDKTIRGTGGMPEQIRFEWRQIGGPFAILSNSTIADPTVDVPIIDEDDAILSFELTVTDYVGVSDSDAVEIHVKANNTSKSDLLEPVNLSDNAEANSTNASVASSDNFVYVLWNESAVGNTELLLKASSDGGRTFQDAARVWKTPNPISNISVVASSNNVYAEWTEGGSYGAGSWFIASSNDHGKNFSRPMIFPDTGLSPDFLISKDNVYVAWMPINQDTGARDTIHLKASHDAGKRFTEQTLYVSEKSISEVKLSSSEDKVHLVWSNRDGTQKGSTYYMQSTDETGKTFTVPLEIATDVISVDFVTVHTNDIYVLIYTEEHAETPSTTYSYGKISLLHSSDGGKSFTEILASDDPATDGGAKYYRNRALSVSENNIYVTWSEYGLKQGKLYVMSSSDGGKTFAKTVVDNASYLTFGSDQTSFDDEESPYKIISSGQNVSLVYQSPIKSGDDIHSFLVSSDDSGKTFEKRVRLGNAVDGYLEFFPRIVSSSDGTIHVTWISGKIDVPLPIDADTFYSAIGKSGKDLTVESLQTHTSPLKQFMSGIPTNEIQCKESLVLMVKQNGNPACVTLATADKLINRGWTNAKLDEHVLKYSPVLFSGTGIDLQGDDLIQHLKNKRDQLDIALDEVGAKRLYPLTGMSFSIGNNAYSLDEKYVGSPIALEIRVLKEEFTKETLEEINHLVRKHVGDEIDIVYSKGVYAVPAPMMVEK